jgi:hypothetical protein
MKKRRLFSDMTLEEIEAFEKKSNSIVLFDDETGINFQRSLDGDKALVVLIDKLKRPIIILDSQVDALKSWLNNNF